MMAKSREVRVERAGRERQGRDGGVADERHVQIEIECANKLAAKRMLEYPFTPHSLEIALIAHTHILNSMIPLMLYMVKFNLSVYVSGTHLHKHTYSISSAIEISSNELRWHLLHTSLSPAAVYLSITTLCPFSYLLASYLYYS